MQMDLVSMQIAVGDAMLRRCCILGTANFDECGTLFILSNARVRQWLDNLAEIPREERGMSGPSYMQG